MLNRTVVHHTILKKSGGAAKVALLLHQGLLERGHNSLHSFEASEISSEELTSPQDAAQEIPENSIVHLHTSTDPALFLRSLPEDCKTVITLHDSQMITGGCASPMDCPEFERECNLCPRKFPESRKVRGERIAAIIDSDAVLVCPSGWLGRQARKAHPDLKPKIIPNGIPWPENPADKIHSRRELGIHPASKVMLFVAHGGMQAAYKSGPQWKNYWATIKSAVPEALCFAIGGSENSRDGDFISIPYVDSSTLAKFLAAADVLAYPTLGDNHPLIILEAMAQSLAAVSYAVGGVVEQISDGEDGLLIPPYEKTIFTEKVIMLLQNSRAAREMGSRGFHKGKKRYSHVRMIDDYNKIYASLV
ncbi:glycosyltransferase [Desulfovibrio sp. JC022]|uniref:glycosyltransferase n=1 Tax=Desulfovibrio sp. JC022 TaxID=2593642 RepID=UPI0013D0B642|nr:glycosyltransferase [Desulfovibrio sp. JC022]NDV24225.1 glycosyltransferase [Desulfovibrio sp. JC022]